MCIRDSPPPHTHTHTHTRHLTDAIQAKKPTTYTQLTYSDFTSFPNSPSSPKQAPNASLIYIPALLLVPSASGRCNKYGTIKFPISLYKRATIIILAKAIHQIQQRSTKESLSFEARSHKRVRSLPKRRFIVDGRNVAENRAWFERTGS